MDTLQIVQSSGMSDAVQLAIVAGIIAIATLVIKAVIEAQAKKAEVSAALEAAKVSQKLQEVEVKIDGRLTELLRITKAEAEERGQRLGKEQQKSEDGGKVHEAPLPTGIHDTGPVKLTITEGEIKVVPEPTKKKKP